MKLSTFPSVYLMQMLIFGPGDKFFLKIRLLKLVRERTARKESKKARSWISTDYRGGIQIQTHSEVLKILWTEIGKKKKKHAPFAKLEGLCTINSESLSTSNMDHLNGFRGKTGWNFAHFFSALSGADANIWTRGWVFLENKVLNFWNFFLGRETQVEKQRKHEFEDAQTYKPATRAEHAHVPQNFRPQRER